MKPASNPTGMNMAAQGESVFGAGRGKIELSAAVIRMVITAIPQASQYARKGLMISLPIYKSFYNVNC